MCQDWIALGTNAIHDQGPVLPAARTCMRLKQNGFESTG
jgi:hypothetical protein